MKTKTLALLTLVLVVFGSAYVATNPAGGGDGVAGEIIAYGSAPSAFGRLWVPPSRADAGAPLVILVHGGFWQRRGGDLSLMSPLAEDLHARGYAVWNIEYGRVGETFGGWPHTFDHVAAAVDHVAELADVYGVDEARVAVIGHSAGGHLALWVHGRGDLDAGWPGSLPTVEPSLVIALAPIADLHAAADDGLGNRAVSKLLGGLPEVVPDRYRIATPRRMDASAHIVVGGLDDTVPRQYSIVEGTEATVWTVDGVDHLGLINPEGPSGTQIRHILANWDSQRE